MGLYSHIEGLEIMADGREVEVFVFDIELATFIPRKEGTSGGDGVGSSRS